jgi:ATP-dependent Clp protease adapter protein ClpS
MNIIAAIRQEERKLEKELHQLRRKLEGVRAAGKALGGSASRELRTVKKRVLSEAGKANIIRAAKKRWAKIRAEGKALKGSASREVTTIKKRVLSDAGKRNIARAAKKRWAKFRAETKKAAA